MGLRKLNETKVAVTQTNVSFCTDKYTSFRGRGSSIFLNFYLIGQIRNGKRKNRSLSPFNNRPLYCSAFSRIDLLPPPLSPFSSRYFSSHIYLSYHTCINFYTVFLCYRAHCMETEIRRGKDPHLYSQDMVWIGLTFYRDTLRNLVLSRSTGTGQRGFILCRFHYSQSIDLINHHIFGSSRGQTNLQITPLT